MDSETRDALIAVCETLKAEAEHETVIHSLLGRIYEALKIAVPGFEKAYGDQNPQPRGSLDVGERIRSIDALLKKLRKE
jgi:hypothetical protein